ncbi:STM3941 family protein [Mucilaginibacter sp. L196]|uniref:STM3941 family protein n=1 Tax=Mucilaginibacter sp. L196 TaxID=1641870 RepID=UPI00131BC2CD|nr:STM3941 family protein [Mucilaginibacter sp. L196]
MKVDYDVNAGSIAIPQSKTKLALLLLLSLTFVALGLWIIQNASSPENLDNWHRWKGLIAGFSSIIFFGGCSLAFLFMLFNNNPGLIVDDKGITINPGIFSNRFIPWNQVEKFSIQQVLQTKLIGVHLKNPEEYIEQQKGAWIKRTLKLNYKNFGAPLSIATNNLKGNFDTIYSLLTSRLSSYTLNAKTNVIE